MKKALLISLAVFLTGWLPLAAQEGVISGNSPVAKTYREAEAALLSHNYKKAIRLFEQCLRTHPDLAAAYRGLGICYQLLKDYPEAARQFDQVITLDSAFSRVLYFEAGEAHYKSGNYDKALEYFQRFDSLQSRPAETFGYHGDREREAEAEYLPRLAANIRACHISLDSSKFQGIDRVDNLGAGINTPANEYFPCLSNDQRLIFYTSQRNNRADEDLFYSTDDGSGWSRGAPFQSFNTNQNEGMSTLVRNGRTLFFTACGRDGVLGTCDIWSAELDDLKIKSVGALDGYANSERWESQAAISCDGSTLFFASDRPGGLGKTDIWYSKRGPDGRWSDPVNLGPKINTAYDEESPFITNDGKTLYFASTGHPGMGEQDIFVSWLDADGSWSTPINLGPPVNTAYRELGFFLSADGRTGYFASDRPDGYGGMDIYKFELSEQLHSDPITFVEGQVIDSLSEEPIATTVNIDGRGGVRTDEDGRFFLCMPAGQELRLLIQEPNYSPYRVRLTVPEWDNRQPYRLDIRLSPLRSFTARAPIPEDPILPPKPKVEMEYTCALFYDFDSYKLDIRGTNQLDDFMRSFEKKEIVRVEIVGYADDIGTDEYNLKLSEERAKNIAIFMREYGIIVNKVFLEARGEVKDDNPKSKNRRVEVRVFTLE